MAQRLYTEFVTHTNKRADTSPQKNEEKEIEDEQ
jgi:hypothetical protein